ncbi:MAG: hypothetical protein AB1384_07900, partial [Actinomycetota bacterium]
MGKKRRETHGRKATRSAFILAIVLALVLWTVPGVADSAYKAPTANPTFTYGSIVSGSYVNVQTVDGTYMRVREGRLWIFCILNSIWAGWQPFTETSRSKLIDIQIELVGYQSDASERWYVQFYNYDTGAWDSSYYSLGSLPTTPEGTRTVAVGDAAKARTLVSAAGAFQLRLVDGGIGNGSIWDFTQTDVYIDMLRARFVYDITPPVSSITAPASGTQTNAHAYTVTGTSSDPTPDAGGVTAVDVSTDGGA